MGYTFATLLIQRKKYKDKYTNLRSFLRIQRSIWFKTLNYKWHVIAGESRCTLFYNLQYVQFKWYDREVYVVRSLSSEVHLFIFSDRALICDWCYINLFIPSLMKFSCRSTGSLKPPIVNRFFASNTVQLRLANAYR